MQIFLTGRNLEVTEALRRYAEEKVGRLQKYLDKITSAHIVLSLQKYRQIAEVTPRGREHRGSVFLDRSGDGEGGTPVTQI
jgi:putative sigma-54 modulation protein